ncbi:conserved hypothetical protein [Paraburkholderia piptadeniae]|uniref:Core-binding (CB) domain-containing protein n=1 Tax=Paraburkholderia piptadeniae TaxID=1701573 RepID=A0A1N7RZW7_9BURK|nr:hypothetical protein [Paraburkholderia piptadeniae]SIT40614.1 conserved hypothetical protein [Paraburkholderia piptadeniae]
MARTKCYQVSAARKEQLCLAEASVEAVAHSAKADGARIDIGALLGPGARFTNSVRNIDYSGWLNRGIDPWVWSALGSFRSLLCSGAREISSVVSYAYAFQHFLTFLTEGQNTPRVATPADLAPSDVDAFVEWIRLRAQQGGLDPETTRSRFKAVKSVLQEMFAQGYIAGESTRFFKSKTFPRGTGESRCTGLSDAEQGRLATAIKTDLVAVHHGRLSLNQGQVQALRLLLVAHRQGSNVTPLLEMRRDAMGPGLLPGTIRICTAKFRSRHRRSSHRRSSVGRAESVKSELRTDPMGLASDELVFGLAEGAVIQQAISLTEDLVSEAPIAYKNRVWLYRTPKQQKGIVTCLTRQTMLEAIWALVDRHGLTGDDGRPMRLNLSRLRKAYFDRALRYADGNLAKTANLMGNTPRVAAFNYPSMNEARKVDAAVFMNEDYLDLMRDAGGTSDTQRWLRKFGQFIEWKSWGVSRS